MIDQHNDRHDDPHGGKSRPDIPERLSRLEEQVSNLVSALREDREEARRLWKHFDSLANRMGAINKTDWKVIFAGVGLLLTVLVPTVSAAFGFIIYMNAQVSSISGAVHDMKISIEKNSSNIGENTTRIERRLNEHVMSEGHPTSIMEVQKLRGLVTERVNEMETQMRNLGDRINDSIAERHRMDQILWGQVYPDKPYPDIIYWVPAMEHKSFGENNEIQLPKMGGSQ